MGQCAKCALCAALAVAVVLGVGGHYLYSNMCQCTAGGANTINQGLQWTSAVSKVNAYIQGGPAVAGACIDDGEPCFNLSSFPKQYGPVKVETIRGVNTLVVKDFRMVCSEAGQWAIEADATVSRLQIAGTMEACEPGWLGGRCTSTRGNTLFDSEGVAPQGIDVKINTTVTCHNSSFASLTDSSFAFQGVEVAGIDLGPTISSDFNTYLTMNPFELPGHLKLYCAKCAMSPTNLLARAPAWVAPGSAWLSALSACAFLISSCMFACSIRHGTVSGSTSISQRPLLDPE